METEVTAKAIADLRRLLEREDLSDEQRADIKEEIGCIGMSAFLTELFKEDNNT